MVRNLIVVLVLAIVAGLVYDSGRRMSESGVREHYRDQLEAFRAADEKALCGTAAEDFSLHVVERTDDRSSRATLDGPAACEQIKATLGLMRMMSEQTRGLVSVDLSYDIKSIEISPDGRTATVESTSTARIGDRLLSRARSKERLSRSFWRIRSHGGESQTWAYGG